MKKIIFIIFYFILFQSNAQNYLCLGVNAGWRNTGPKCSYLFLKKVEMETLLEWHRYNSFGVAGFINFYPIKENLSNQTGYFGVGYSNTFNTITGVEYNKMFYKYKITEINYLIPKIGFSLNEIIDKKSSILKAIILSLELQYAFPLKKSSITMLDNKAEDFGLTKKIDNYYNKRNFGINFQVKFGLKK